MSRYQKMDPEFKTRWIAALRSGDYKQVRGGLRLSLSYLERRPSEYGYCCLGVAADLLHPDEWKTHGGGAFEMHDSANLLRHSILHEINLSDEAQQVLAGLNDTTRLSFYDIADWIEENL